MSTLVNRESELDALRDGWCSALAGHPQIFLIDGDPGIGKTALISRFLEQVEADEPLVLRGGGEQDEHDLPLATFDHLLRPVADLVPDAALLGSDVDGVHDPLIAGARFLNVVSALEQQGPVVLVIEDLQWCDEATARALTFLFRRLHHDRVMVVLAIRTEDLPTISPGLRRVVDQRGRHLELAGLTADQLRELAKSLGASPLSQDRARALYAETAGNPLYARSILTAVPAVSVWQLASVDDLDAAPKRIAADMYAAEIAARVDASPPKARRLARALAVCGMAAQVSMAAAVAGVDDIDQAMDDLAGARVVRVDDASDGQRLAFVHPLARTAVYHGAPAGERRELHRAAAEHSLSRQERMRHRVAAVRPPDDDLAAELEEYARDQVASISWAGAAWAMAAASRMSSQRDERERRTLTAIAHAVSAGDAGLASRLTAGLDGFAPTPRRQFIEGLLAALQGDPRRGERLLRSAWEALGGPESDPGLADAIGGWLSALVVNDGRAADGVEYAGWLARRAARGVPGLENVPAALGALWLAADGTDVLLAQHVGDLASYELGSAPDATRTGLILGRAVLGLWRESVDTVWQDLAAVTPALRRRGPFVDLAIALIYTSDTAYRIGRWDDAATYGELAASAVADGDQGFLLALAHSVAAWPLAGRGQWAEAQAHVQQATAAADMIGDLGAKLWSAMTVARLAHAKGEMGGVIAAVEPLLSLPHTVGLHSPSTQPWEGMYGEALIHEGRLDDARRVAAQLETTPDLRARPRAQAEAVWLRGLLAAAGGRVAQANTLLSRATEIAARGQQTFLEARTRLAYGATLGRAGETEMATRELDRARRTFMQLGAVPYVARVTETLEGLGTKAVGRRPPAAPAAIHQQLTARELSVAVVAGQGMRNREIARELMVSVKTVEYHLSNIYDKLGINSRAALARLLATSEADPT